MPTSSCSRSATPSRPAAKPGPTVISATAASLDLVGEQQELFDALKALGKPIVVVLINGRPASTVEISAQADALIEGWYLGEQGGHAMADVLFGDVNPGGKLPVTIPRNAGQLPLFYNHKPSARRGYLFDTVEPALPVRLGSELHDLRDRRAELSAATIAVDGTVEVRVRCAATPASRAATRLCSSTFATRSAR